MLSVVNKPIMLSVVMLSIVRLNVVMLSIVAPYLDKKFWPRLILTLLCSLLPFVLSRRFKYLSLRTPTEGNGSVRLTSLYTN
jgi:hypothetical protein